MIKISNTSFCEVAASFSKQTLFTEMSYMFTVSQRTYHECGEVGIEEATCCAMQYLQPSKYKIHLTTNYIEILPLLSNLFLNMCLNKGFIVCFKCSLKSMGLCYYFFIILLLGALKLIHKKQKQVLYAELQHTSLNWSLTQTRSLHQHCSQEQR